jgi:hypothetical protein
MKTHSERSVTPARVGLALLLGLVAWPGGAWAQDREPGRPWPPLTLSFAASAVMPSAGVDLSWQVLDRLAVGLQLTTLVVHFDASLRTRLSLAGDRRGGPYLGANLHLWYSPLVLSQVTEAVSGELGWEWRSGGGLVVGLGLGAGGIRVPAGSDSAASRARWELLPMANLRVGRSW